MKKRVLLPTAVVALALVTFQVVATHLGKDYYLTQMIMAAYYSIVVLGLSLVMGYAGQISLGHGAFFAIGGYTSAVLTTRDFTAVQTTSWGALLRAAHIFAPRTDLYGGTIVTVSPWAAFAAALVLTLAVAALVGYPSLRLKGQYLAMATLGFGLIVYRLLLGSPFTGAADGVTGVPPWPLGFGLVVSGRPVHRIQNYYLAWGLALGVTVVLVNLVHSRAGRAFRSIHGGETAANSMGIDTAAYKLKAFLLSALLASAAGSLLTHYNGSIGPSEAGAMKSVRYVALVAAGGMANLWGVLITSALLNYLSLRGCFGSLDQAVFGALLIAIISLAPEGPLKPIAAWIERAAGRVRGAGRQAGAALAGEHPAPVRQE